MTHTCCPGCLVRFTSAQAAYLVVCPECGGPLRSEVPAELLLGMRLNVEPAHDVVPEAIEARLPDPTRSSS